MRKKIRNISILPVLLMLFFSFSIFQIKAPPIHALDVKNLAAEEKNLKNTDSNIEKYEVSKKWFFNHVQINLDELLKKKPDLTLLEFIMGHYDYLDLSRYNPDSKGWQPKIDMLDELLENEYNMSKNVKFGKYQYDAICKLMAKFAKYYTFKYGINNYNSNEEAITTEVQSALKNFFNYYISQDISESDRNSILSFVDDFDKFLDKFYREKTIGYFAKLNSENEVKQKNIQDIKSGQKKILTMEDAKIFYDAESGFQVVDAPPVKPTEKYYYVSGTLESMDGNHFIVRRIIDGELKYFVFELDKSVKEPKFRIDGELEIVGLFSHLYKYTTTMGAERFAPFFKAVFVEL